MLFCFSACSINEDNQIRFLIPEIKMTLCFKSDIKDTARVHRAKCLAEQVQSSSLDLTFCNICLDILCVCSYLCFNLWQILDTFKCYVSVYIHTVRAFWRYFGIISGSNNHNPKPECTIYKNYSIIVDTELKGTHKNHWV